MKVRVGHGACLRRKSANAGREVGDDVMPTGFGTAWSTAMKIRSIFLGSAAALFAVSGARAADAVVIAEPEPVEYVRVCDVYGTGFYYMPGTETCLRVGGYLRYDIGVGFLGHEDVLDKKDLAEDGI